MKSIYCCGPHGNVGWVKGWRHDEFRPEIIVGVDLTLNHTEAHVFGHDKSGATGFQEVLDYVTAYDATFGNPEVFTWEEP